MIPRCFPSRARCVAVRISRRYLVALMVGLPACYSWQPVDLAPSPRFGRRASVRVERSDGTRVHLARPRIAGDSIVGSTGHLRTPVSLPLTGVTRAWQSRFSGRKTAVLVGFMGLGAALIYQGLSDMNVGLAPSGGCFGGC